jgi:hypothetical protein
MPRSETPLRSDLFPEISPYASGMLAVDGRHTLYWEQSGNPEGVPVVFLHGGPGAGSAPVHRRFFDPQFYRIIVFDQRGCGRSMPLGDLHDNTTGHLVDDMEKLRVPSRHPALAAVRRLVGAARSRWPTASAIPSAPPASSCAASSSARSPRSTGSFTACARSSPRRGATSPSICRPTSVAICWATIIAA